MMRMKNILFGNRLNLLYVHTKISITKSPVERDSDRKPSCERNDKLDVFVNKLTSKHSKDKRSLDSDASSMNDKKVYQKKSNIFVNDGASKSLEKNKKNGESLDTDIEMIVLPEHDYVTDDLTLKKKEIKKHTVSDVDPLNELSSHQVNQVEKESVYNNLPNISSLEEIRKSYEIVQHMSHNQINHKAGHRKKANVNASYITEAEHSSLLELLKHSKATEAVFQIENYVSQHRQVSFGILRSCCACACTSGLVTEVHRIKEVAEKVYPHLYKNHLNFDNYLASALCFKGEFQESLDLLTTLYCTKQKGIKKIKDAASHVIFNIMKTEELKDEKRVLQFVTDLAEKQNILNPALALWRICFCSNSYRKQKIASDLVEKYSSLVEMLPNKLQSIINQGYQDADVDLMYRTIELLLAHQFTEYYVLATSSLLQYQCEVGDITGANQTLKFVQLMRVQLKPELIEQLLVSFAKGRQPAVPELLAINFRFPSNPVLHRTPKFKYKF